MQYIVVEPGGWRSCTLVQRCQFLIWEAVSPADPSLDPTLPTLHVQAKRTPRMNEIITSTETGTIQNFRVANLETQRPLKVAVPQKLRVLIVNDASFYVQHAYLWSYAQAGGKMTLRSVHIITVWAPAIFRDCHQLQPPL